MDKTHVIQTLEQQVKDAGGIRAWSRAHEGFSASYISEVLKDNIQPSKKLITLLGFETVITYRPIKDAA
jgi:hypothetical protein